MVVELVTLSLVAGVVGLVCGYFIAATLLPDVAASLRGLYGAQIPGQLSLKREWWAAGLAISVIGALGASAASLIKASRLPILAAAQPYAWQEAQQRWLWRQGAAASVMALAAIALLWFGDFAVTGFAVLAAILVGAALGLPAMLGLVLKLGESATRKPVATWFWADSRLQLSGLSLALMALLLALGVNVGVGTMVDSFSRTFRWIDGRLASDVYVGATSEAQAREIKAWLRPRPKCRLPLPGGSAARRPTVRDHRFRRPSDLSRPLAVVRIRHECWDRVAPAMRRWSASRWRGGELSLGDKLQVPTPDGPWALEVSAIYADYGNPRGQLVVENGASRAFPTSRRPGRPARDAPRCRS